MDDLGYDMGSGGGDKMLNNTSRDRLSEWRNSTSSDFRSVELLVSLRFCTSNECQKFRVFLSGLRVSTKLFSQNLIE